MFQARGVNRGDLRDPNVMGIACGLEAPDTISEVLGASRDAVRWSRCPAPA